MKQFQDGYFYAKDGIKLYYQWWLPEKSPRGILLLCHGIAEHSGRYADVAGLLTKQDILVCGYDLRGHGKSEGKRCDISHFDQYIEDTKLYFDWIKSQHESIPTFLLGHSMGSLIAIGFACLYENLLQGLIISGTGNKTGGNVHPLLIRLVKVLSKVIPHISLKATDLTNYISHDVQEVEKNRKDPLVHQGGISFRLAAEMVRRFENNDQLISQLKLPTLFQAGGDDQLVLGASEIASRLKMEDQTIYIYPGLWHEIYNETIEQREQVLFHLQDWITKRIAM